MLPKPKIDGNSRDPKYNTLARKRRCKRRKWHERKRNPTVQIQNRNRSVEAEKPEASNSTSTQARNARSSTRKNRRLEDDRRREMCANFGRFMHVWSLGSSRQLEGEDMKRSKRRHAPDPKRRKRKPTPRRRRRTITGADSRRRLRWFSFVFSSFALVQVVGFGCFRSLHRFAKAFHPSKPFWSRHFTRFSIRADAVLTWGGPGSRRCG